MILAVVQDTLVHLFADVLAQDVAGEGLAHVQVLIVSVKGPEMHQLQGQFIVVLQGMDQRGRIDAKIVDLAQHQPQELGSTGQQRVLIGRASDEVIGQIGAAVGHGGDVVDGQVQFLKAETTGLADRPGQ
jgi:hypothetical protein